MAKRGTKSFDDYAAFVDKFKHKKTTDDCYTPAKVYEAVLGYVRDRYGVPEDALILRPFKPGGDFESEEYPDGSFVIDNPPFSILARIVRFYCAKGVRFFLFAPTLTLFSAFSPANDMTCVATSVQVEYANGAKVNTSFVTNMGDSDVLAESDPALHAALQEAVDEVRRKKVKTLPKYEFPDNVCTAAMLGKYSKYGVDFKVRRGEAVKVSKLDAQGGGSIYGGAFLLGDGLAAERAAAERAAAERAAAERAAAERAAAERAAAERAAAERAAATKWWLSPRERALVNQLKPLEK